MTELATRDQAQIVEAVIAAGDLKSLTPEQRNEYLLKVCSSLGLNPLTLPFQYIVLNGRLTLYATRGCTDQLRKIHHVSTQILSRERHDDVYVVTARATDREGRADESIGAVAVGGLKGELLCNALMKCETKAKRRATLALVGLSFLDESELDTVPDARPYHDPPPAATAPPAGAISPKGEALIAHMDATVAEFAAADAEGAVQGERLAAARLRAQPWTVPADDVDALVGKELWEVCQKMKRLLRARELMVPPDPADRSSVPAWRSWWHGCVALLRAADQAVAEHAAASAG